MRERERERERERRGEDEKNGVPGERSSVNLVFVEFRNLNCCSTHTPRVMLLETRYQPQVVLIESVSVGVASDQSVLAGFDLLWTTLIYMLHKCKDLLLRKKISYVESKLQTLFMY